MHRLYLRDYRASLSHLLFVLLAEFSPYQSPEILKLRSNEILTAVVQGARRDEPSSEVQLAAMKALYNCLEFIKENFDREVLDGILLAFCTD